MVTELISDGVGHWEDVVEGDVSITSDDPSTVNVSGSPRQVVAKTYGSTNVHARLGVHSAATPFTVSALTTGSKATLLGAIRNPHGVAYSNSLGLLVTNQSNIVYQWRRGHPCERFVQLPSAYLATNGVDAIVIDEEDSVFVRSVQRNCVYRIDPSNKGKLDTISLGDDATPFYLCTTGNALFISDFSGNVWLHQDGVLSKYFSTGQSQPSPSSALRIAVDSQHLWAIDTGTTLFTLNRDTELVTVSQLHCAPNQYSAVLAVGGSLLVSDFHGGSIARLDEHHHPSTLADGFDIPNHFAAGPDGILYVTNFGSSGISRVIL
jgi:sugar lactone lactonase YvrE